ncbi:MAG: type II toxin-antitoxin system VapC family toxin [Spirochaetota bacterium]|nr:type II toxin-antitoxin system VapC family toxin [Spirochaetota bacterium]
MEDVVVLDTDILFAFLGDLETAAETEKILLAGKGSISSITVYELFRGVESKKHLKQRRSLLSYLHSIDLTTSIAREAGLLYTLLRKKGLTVSNEDILIAAACIHDNIPLFTGNRKHFESMPGLRLYNAVV